MSHDIVLWIHVATGCIAWIVGAAALWTNLPGRRSHGALAAFHWSVLAPRDRSLGWLRLGIHGQGGACIALVTATFVVSVDGLARIAAWTLPTLIGVPLLELWYRRAAALAPDGSRA
jgi:hypothetical protein